MLGSLHLDDGQHHALFFKSADGSGFFVSGFDSNGSSGMASTLLASFAVCMVGSEVEGFSGTLYVFLLMLLPGDLIDKTGDLGDSAVLPGDLLANLVLPGNLLDKTVLP